MKPGSTADAPPKEALTLHESAAVDLAEGVGADGTVLLHIIRPGWGQGRGSHYYSPEMLRENAHKFAGWKMFVDHLAPEAKKKAGGLPRSIRDLGGRIVESWFDDTVPADDRHEQGAVVGRCKPTPFVRELIENDPEIVEASISAQAEGVRPHRDNSHRGWAVEGIESRGSVDWVTEAGAGGRVVALMEAVYDDTDINDVELIEAMTDDEFTEYVRERRPELIEALAEEAGAEGNNDSPEEESMELTPEALAEAINSNEELSSALDEIVEARVTARVEQVVGGLDISAQIEEALADERALIRAEASADSDRRIALRDFRDEAHEMIESALKTQPTFAERAKAKFALTESGPTPLLDVIDEIDDEGNIVKPAKDKLHDNVQAEIAEQRAILAEARPTRVRGQGPSVEEATDADGKNKPTASHKDGLTGNLLQEAGFDSDVDPWNPELSLRG